MSTKRSKTEHRRSRAPESENTPQWRVSPAPDRRGITTGAESDIQNLTKIARGMVGRWGMTDAVGPLAVGEGREEGALLPGVSPASPATQQIVDEEARRIVETAEDEVIDLLERERLDSPAHALLEHETLDQREAYRLAGVTPAAEAETTPKEHV